MLVWLEVAWPNPVLTTIFEIIELARLIAHLLLFFFFWWHWVSALPPVCLLRISTAAVGDSYIQFSSLGGVSEGSE